MIIKYKRTVQSTAMSKRPYQNGLSLEIDRRDNVVRIESINPRTNQITTYLSMEIPIEQIEEVINALKSLNEFKNI